MSEAFEEQATVPIADIKTVVPVILYDPFAVDDSWLLDSFPALGKMLDEVNQLYVDYYENQSTSDEPLSPQSRSYRRPHSSADRIFAELWQFGCQTSVLHGGGEAGAARLREVVLGLTNGNQEAQRLANDIEKRITSSVEEFNSFETGCRDLSQQFSEVVNSKDPATEYGYLKLFSGIKARPQDGRYERWNARQTFGAMLSYNDTPMLSLISQKLAEGAYDDFIAADLVAFVADERSEVVNGMGKVKELYDFLRLFNPSMTHEEIVKRQVDLVAAWPKDAHMAFDAAKARLGRDYEAYLEWSTSEAGVGDFMGIARDNPQCETQFTRSVSEYINKVVMTGKYGARNAPPMLNKVQEVEAALAARRKRRQGQVGRTTVRATRSAFEALVPESAQQPREPWKIGRIRSDGAVVEGLEESEIVEAIKVDYFDRYKNANDTNMQSFITTVLQAMSELDFSTGHSEGVKKFKDAFLKTPVENMATRLQLMEFKPRNVNGMSMSAVRANKIRVIFVKMEDTLAILDIVERDDVYQYLRNKGVRSTGRKG